MKPLAQLKAFIASWLPDLRRQRNYEAVIEVEAITTIADEAEAQQGIAHDLAFKAQQADLEAVAIIERAAADGLDQSDMPAISRALRHIRNSAENDRRVTEVLA